MFKRKKEINSVTVDSSAAATAVNDVKPGEIRYRGFFTFRGLRLIALNFMTVAQLAMIILPIHRLCLALQLPTMVGAGTIRYLEICSNLSQASFAMLMISTIGMVLNRQTSFRKMLIEYFILALLTYLAIVFIVAGIVQKVIYGLPSEVPMISDMLKELNIPDAVKAGLIRLIKLILPGDGTVHIDALNTFFSALGIKASVPGIDQLIKMIPGGTNVQDFVRMIISFVAQQDVTPTVTSLVNFFGKEILSITAELSDIAGGFLLPWLSGLICNMLNTNVYWDMFLYTLFYFFVSWQPPKLSPGKQMLFHCCAVLPAFWMVLSYFVSTQLHVFSATQRPVWFVALLSNIKPSILVLFFMLVLFEKYNELEYAGNPKYSHMDPTEYLGSNKASLNFSVTASIMILLICFGDYLLGLIPGLDRWGFGESGMMWLCIPFLLLYSFNKQPKHKIFNAAVPLYYVFNYVGIFFVAFVSISYVYFLLVGI